MKSVITLGYGLDLHRLIYFWEGAIPSYLVTELFSGNSIIVIAGYVYELFPYSTQGSTSCKLTWVQIASLVTKFVDFVWR